MDDSLPLSWLTFAELISDDQEEFVAIKSVLAKQLTKIRAHNKLISSKSLPNEPQDLSPNIRFAIGDPHSVEPTSGEDGRPPEDLAMIEERRKRRNRRRGGKGKKPKPSDSSEPAPKPTSVVNASVRFIKDMFGPKGAGDSARDNQLPKNNASRPTKFRAEEGTPVKVAFKTFLLEDGRYVKNGTELRGENYFDDLNYGELLLGFPNEERHITSKWRPFLYDFGDMFRYFKESINMKSDEPEINQWVNQELPRDRKTLLL
jgi:hypothetical protein